MTGRVAVLVLMVLVPAGLRAATSNVDPSLRALLAAPRESAASARLPVDAVGRVRVLVEVDTMTARLRERLEQLGCRIERQRHDLLQVWLPRAAVEEIAAMREVRRVRLADAVTGNRASGAEHPTGVEVGIEVVRSDFESTGRGVVVGVISIGVAGLAESVQRGWLPATTFWCRDPAGVVRSRSTGCGPGETLIRTAGGVTARSFRDDGDLAPSHSGSAEGTAVLELVHRLAPDAELWFVNVATGLDLLDAIDALAANVDVLVSDIIVHAYFPDGRSVIAQTVATIVTDPAARVRAFVQPIRNPALAHYAARYQPSATDDDRGRRHFFRAEGDTEGPQAPTAWNRVRVPPAGTISIYLPWDRSDPEGKYRVQLVDCDSGAPRRGDRDAEACRRTWPRSCSSWIRASCTGRAASTPRRRRRPFAARGWGRGRGGNRRSRRGDNDRATLR